MTITATLDLDKAIETFKNTMQLLLQWGDLSEWATMKLDKPGQPSQGSNPLNQGLYKHQQGCPGLFTFRAGDGQRFKQLEEQIRQTALELAGQCIALMLHQLSEDQIAQQEANRRTDSSRGFGSHSLGRQRVKMTTLGNVEVSLAVTYVLNRRARVNQDKQGQKRKPGQRGQFAWAGILSIVTMVSNGRTSDTFGVVNGSSPGLG